MNIQQLEYLIAVDKYKHFRKAAEACFVTQPTLSAMVQKLEDELGVKIFDRTSHPIRTTDAGIQIIKQAGFIIDSVNELKKTADSLNDVVGGHLNLGIIPTVSGNVLPIEIFDFLDNHPKITMNIKEMTTENIIKSLQAGVLDAGIIATPHSDAEEFFNELIFNEELMVYSSEVHESKDSFVVPEEVNPEKVWLLEEGNCLRTQFENICNLKEHRQKPKNLEFLASNVISLVHMVDKLGGVTILPELSVDLLNADQKKHVARFKEPFPHREISIIYYKPTYKQKIIDELIIHIQKSVKGKLGYGLNPEKYTNVSPQ